MTRANAKVWSVGLITVPEKAVALARKNNIPRAVVYNRIIEAGWSIYKAVTFPVKQKASKLYTKEDLEQAAANGIGRSTFTGRFVTRDWDLERAKTQKPVNGKG